MNFSSLSRVVVISFGSVTRGRGWLKSGRGSLRVWGTPLGSSFEGSIFAILCKKAYVCLLVPNYMECMYENTVIKEYGEGCCESFHAPQNRSRGGSQTFVILSGLALAKPHHRPSGSRSPEQLSIRSESFGIGKLDFTSSIDESLRCISTTSPCFSLTRLFAQNKPIAHHGRHVHCCRQASWLARGTWNSINRSAIATELHPLSRPAIINSCSLQLAMATLGVTFGVAALSMGGSKKSTAQGPPINASSKEEEAFIKYVFPSSSTSKEHGSRE